MRQSALLRRLSSIDGKPRRSGLAAKLGNSL
jgi:hypothetical protein